MPTKAASKSKSKSAQRDFGKPITVATAATRAGVSTKTIHRLRDEFAYRRVGNQIIISEPSFEAFLERNTYGRVQG